VCALNAGPRTMALPDGELLLASGALVDGKLPPNTAAWLV
jgi:alpha-glucosidase